MYFPKDIPLVEKKGAMVLFLALFISGNILALDTLQVIMTIENPFPEQFGNYIKAGGDINGDGYDDIVISNYDWKYHTWQTGQVNIYLGSNSPDTTADYIIYGEQDWDKYGVSVSYAGDINNDGYDDLVVGASDYGYYLWQSVYLFWQ